MRIRIATPKDVDVVFSLATEFATSFAVDNEPFLESFHQIMSDDHALLLLAAEGEHIVGYCLGFAHDTFFANGRVAWVEEIGARAGEFTSQEEGCRAFVDDGVREMVERPGSEARRPGHATGGRVLPSRGL